MKTLIAYATNTGSTLEVANYISKSFNNCKVVNVKTESVNIKKYDLIIFGTGIYLSKIHKDMKKFLKDNSEDLLEKKFAVYFLCANNNDKEIKRYMDKNFKGIIQDNAIEIKHVGGHINPETKSAKAKIHTAFIKSIVEIKDLPGPKIDYKAIDNFIQLLKSITIETNLEPFKINPIPPIKHIETAKEKLKNGSKNSNVQKLKKTDNLQNKTNKK